MTRKLKVFFHMFDAVGPQNACIGLGQVLLQRGHQVYFLTKSDNRVADKFSKYGFITYSLTDPTQESSKDKSPEEAQKEEMQQMIDFGLFDNLEPLEKLKRLLSPEMMEVFFKSNIEYEKQIRVLIDREKPDLIVVDTIGVAPPSLIYSNIPWVLIYCSNPLGFYHSEELPPPTSGYPAAGDRSNWAEYWKVYRECHDETFLVEQRKLLQHFNYPIPDQQNPVLISPYLNIYQFPKELDYHELITIPKNFFRVDAFCREELGKFELPDNFRQNMKQGDKLIYFSLGSIGTSNVKLMKRVISVLAKSPHWFIVSKGAFHKEYDLPERMWGGNYVPQTQILPLVDLAIIHGGNNSFTEAIQFGTPVIVMPLFYDQYDNAQRIQETGYGYLINPYDFQDQQLLDTIESVLGDRELKDKYQRAAERIKASNSKLNACLEMEKVVENFK